LFDAFDRLGAEGIENLPSNLVLITGPSKTGDIELTLTTGVHGPGKWHVIVVQA
jgi:L-lactate dehydrogenase complex protein LldG